MKKLLVILFLAIGYLANSQIQYNPSLFTVTNKSLGVGQGVTTDARSWIRDTLLPPPYMRNYASRAEANTYLYLAKYRTGHFSLYIDSISQTWEYWYRNGTLDANLVLKNSSPVTIDSTIWATLYKVRSDSTLFSNAIAGKLSNSLLPGRILIGGVDSLAHPQTLGNDATVTIGGSVTVNNQWKLLGNSGTTDGSNFVGTTDNIPLTFKVNGQRAGRIDNGNSNVLLGYQAGNIISGINNTAIGHTALKVGTTGFANVAIGSQSLFSNTTGSQNIGLGYNSLFSNISGLGNLGVGQQALDSNLTGNNNVAVGNSALANNTTGMNNTAVGNGAGRGILTGNNNTVIGANVNGLNPALNNNIIIADGQGNQRINVDSTGRVGIGTMTPSAKLNVVGTATISDTTTITTMGVLDSSNRAASTAWVKRQGYGSGGGGSGLLNLNGLTASTQAFATGTSGSDFNIVSTTATHTFNFPNSSPSNRGLLISADWTTFNSKQPALSGTGYSKWAGSTPSYLTPTQVTADLNLFTTSLQGMTPASGGGTTNFLRADGTWTAPAGSSGITQLTGDVTAGPGSGSQVATIAANAVTTSKINNNAVTLAKEATGTANSLRGYDGSGNAAVVTLTTTGSSGPATIAGSVLNIPQYTGGGGGGGIDSTFSKLNWISVDSFGARGDGTSDTTGAITSGLNIFTSSTAHFTAADVGKYFAVGGAGAAGAELITTIAGFTNTTTVTLTASAGTTVSNAKYKYGTDNTTFIQNAINYAHTFPASTVYFRSGRYFVNGAPVTSVGGYNPNSQLYIPLGHYAPSAYQPVMRLLGATPPNLFIDFATGQAPPNGATIIESLRKDSAASVLGSVAETAIYGVFNWTMVYLENMQFRTKTDNQVTDIKPLMTAIDFSHQNFCDIKNVRVQTSSATQSSVKPDSSTVGIYLPIINNGGNNHLNNVMAQGYFNGLIANENTNGDNITIAACWNAIRFDSSYHTSNWNRMLVVWCPYKVTVTSQAYFNITQLDIEHYDAAGAVWFRDSLDLNVTYTPGPGVTRYTMGHINYFIQLAFGGNSSKSFTRNDNFYTSGIIAEPIGFGLRYLSPGGTFAGNDQFGIGGGLAGQHSTSLAIIGGIGYQQSLDFVRGASKKLSLGIGLLAPGADDYFQYNQTRGQIDVYVDSSVGNIQLGGPQAHINPQLTLWRTNKSATFSGNDTVMGALFADSSKFGFITTAGGPMMHWQMPSATLGQRDYYDYIDDGHRYWETVDNGGTPHIFLQMTQSAGVPLYTTVPTGNFGINVATPAEKLEVGGNIISNPVKLHSSIGWTHPVEIGTEGGTLPAFTFHYAGGASDEKNWDYFMQGSTLVLRALNDGISAVTNAMVITRSGYTVPSIVFPNSKIGIGVTTPTAFLHLLAGTATAGTAPLKFTAGTPTTTPEVGSMQYNNGLWIIDSSASKRDTIATRSWVRANGGGGTGGLDTLHVVAVGSGKQIGYTNGADTLFLKSLKADNGLTLATDADSTNHIILGGNLTQNTNITGASTTYALSLGTSGNKLSQLSVAATSIFFNGRIQYNGFGASDANYVVVANASFVILPAITANRTVTVSATGQGEYLYIINQNTSGNTWSFTGTTVKDAAGNTITNLLNGTAYQLIYDGTNFVVIGKN